MTSGNWTITPLFLKIILGWWWPPPSRLPYYYTWSQPKCQATTRPYEQK